MKRIKLLIVGIANRGGGSKTFLINLMKQLSKEQLIEVNAVLPSSYKNLIPGDVKYIFINDDLLSSSIHRLLFENFELLKIIKGAKPDLVFFASEIIPYRIRKMKIPIVTNFHSTVLLDNRYKKGYGVKGIYLHHEGKQSIKRAEAIVFVSYHSQGQILFKYPFLDEKKTYIIYHGIEKQMVENNNGEYLLSIGDRYTHKNYPQLIDVYKMLVEKYQINQSLIIIGSYKSDDEDKLIQKHIQKDKIGDIIIQDAIDNEKIGEYYKHASVYISFSDIESFGMTPLEAFSYHVPVIMKETTALPEIYGKYKGFIDSKFDDMNDIVERIYNAINDKTYRDVLIKQGEALLTEYSWEKTGECYFRLFQKIRIDWEKVHQ